MSFSSSLSSSCPSTTNDTSSLTDYCTVSDITRLSTINQHILLEYLQQRYNQDIIYSFVGDILISINPYRTVQCKNKDESRLSPFPHTLTIANRMYSNILSTSTDQCCIISGESGAGKTEVCKCLVRHLTELSSGRSSLELRIIQMNPLLEAFGNAQTVVNNNSSRFGKYLQLKFNHHGKVTGAKVNEYLLEKSRVVFQNPGEKNFHVFYWVLDGLDPSLKMQLYIEENRYKYLGGEVKFSGEEQEHFKKLKECFDLVGFDEKEQEDIYVILAVILHLGNIEFEIDQNEFAIIPPHLSGPLDVAALLLGISNNSLTQLLTVTKSTARREIIFKHLSKTKAEATRDAISKSLYDRLFRWIVNRINHLLAPPLEDNTWGCDIGILDIFGFENFQHNSFEQLCINLANEQLHNFFIQHIFRLELEQYTEEGIDGVHVDIPDSQHLLECFLLGSQSVFSLLDDQGSIPRATDDSFLYKLNQKLHAKDTSFFIKSKASKSGQFTIQHYAGKVLYSVEGFLDKNMDLLPAGVSGTLKLSQNNLVSLLYRATITRTGTLSLQRKTSSRMSQKTREGQGRKGKLPTTPTISSQFKSSLNVLVSKMNMTTPHFIRCLKPNGQKRPDLFDDKFIQHQLEYTGMMATIQLRKEGYAYRPSFEEFYERFGCLSFHNSNNNISPLSAFCQSLLTSMGIKHNEYKIGHSKLFLHHIHLEQLETQLKTSQKAAIKIQSMVLGFIQQRRYKKLLNQREIHRQSLKNLLTQIKNSQNKVCSRLERLCNQDEKRHLAGERESMLLQDSFSLPKLGPPGDLRGNLPPHLLLVSDDEDDSNYEIRNTPNTKKRRARPNLRLDHQIFAKFELRRPSAVRTSKSSNQQVRMLRSSVSSSHLWLHGMITQKKAEEMLRGHPSGSFLVRINRKKLSHILCYKSCDGNIYHLAISQLPNGKYIMSETSKGDNAVHDSIEDLIEFYSYTPLNGNESDYLLHPCGEDGIIINGSSDDGNPFEIQLTNKVAVV